MNDALMQLGLQEDDQIVLDEAALLLAQPDHPDVDLSTRLNLLDEMTARLLERGANASSVYDQAILLANVIAGEFHFRGDVDDYDNPANADLIAVLERRLGMPIALSIIYVALARRVGWEAAGLNIPGHLLIRIGPPHACVVIDPFNAGAIAPPDTIARLFAQANSAAPAALPTLSNRDTLVRLLQNQASRAQQAGELERALAVRERMTAVAPQYGQLWWERANVERELGQIAAARNSLFALFEMTRDPNERQRIRATLDELARSIN